MRTLAVVLFGLLIAPDGHCQSIVVGSKNFEESRLLAEMFVQLLEAKTDLEVERRFGLAGTQVCFEALRTGAIDLYPEYTGTGLASLLGRSPMASPGATFQLVRREFAERWDLWWLAPLGFENAYEIAVPSQLAAQHDLQRISDLASHAAQWTAGLGYEFVERPDGLPGLQTAYGIEFANVRPMQQALKFQAAAEGEIQVLDVYTTDGQIEAFDLKVLEDDLRFFPPYEAAPLMRSETARRHPEVILTLGLLAGSLSEATMRQLNSRLQMGEEEISHVATDALTDLALLDESTSGTRATQGDGLLQLMWNQRRRLLQLTSRHMALVAGALLAGVLVAVPLGLFLERNPSIAEPVIRAIGLTQTIPSIALLAFMIPLFGIGVLPALVALWTYSLFPILRNTYTGLREAAPEAVSAGISLGMTEAQALYQVRLPLAAPVIMAGIRTAAVLTVGTATLAAFIGAGGLGEPILTGMQLADTRLILFGALPAAALALAVDLVLGRVADRLQPYSGNQTS